MQSISLPYSQTPSSLALACLFTSPRNICLVLLSSLAHPGSSFAGNGGGAYESCKCSRSGDPGIVMESTLFRARVGLGIMPQRLLLVLHLATTFVSLDTFIWSSKSKVLYSRIGSKLVEWRQLFVAVALETVVGSESVMWRRSQRWTMYSHSFWNAPREVCVGCFTAECCDKLNSPELPRYRLLRKRITSVALEATHLYQEVFIVFLREYRHVHRCAEKHREEKSC